MKFWPCAVFAFSALVTVSAMANPDLGSNPFQTIARSNAFRMQPPLPTETRQVQTLPPPRIMLLGIVRIRNQKQVLLKSVAAPNPREEARELFAILGEGESCSGIQVREINQRTHTVCFQNHGEEQWLSLESDSAKPCADPRTPPAVPPKPAPIKPPIHLPEYDQTPRK